MSIDELGEFGLERMDDDAIGGFLSSRGVGVLALPDDDGAYQIPMSYDYDDESALYFTYQVGEESRKRELSDAAGSADFLVYEADTAYNWECVQLSGSIEAVPESRRDAVREELDGAWRPAVLDDADLSAGVALYEFQIEDRSGVRHTGLPPGFDPDDTA